MQSLLATAEQEAERLRAAAREDGALHLPRAGVASRPSCTA